VSHPLLHQLARIAVVASAAVSAAALPLGAASAGAAASVVAGGIAGGRHVSATSSSLNWSGYLKTGTGFTSTSANFKVPTLLTTYNGNSAAWVGLDGATASDHYLIQTGIEADVINHKASYYAWWEVITPTDAAPEVPFTSFPVKPGDSISASVTKGTSGHWTMTVKDNTTKKTATHTSSFAGKGTSAEWIQEDTDVNGFISTAPDWQSISFTSIRVNGASPKLASSQAIDIVSAPPLGGLLGGHGTRETQTSAPSSTKDGFSVKWLATGTRTHIG
jgi:hypothetical protein